MPVLELVLPPLHPAQREVWEHPARFKVVACGRRWGKTHLGILRCVDVASKGGHAWWVAPTYPIGLIGWELLVALTLPIPGLEVRVGEKKIIFPGGGWVQVKSAERIHGLRGESLDYVVMEECADIAKEAWTEALRPALADRRGGAMFIGTPRGQANWFYDYLWMRATKDDTGAWNGWQMSSYTNPYVADEEIDDARKDMSDIGFAQEFLAEFVVGGGTVFKQQWERYYSPVGYFGSFTGKEQAIWMVADGVEHERCLLRSTMRFLVADTAITTKTYGDYTCIGVWALTPGKRIAWLDCFRERIESPDIAKVMKDLLHKWKGAYVGIEKGGVGTGVIQQARRDGIPVRELTPDKDKMSRAMLAAARMESQQIWYPKGEPPWLDAPRQEIRDYPLAAHDDAVDMLGYAADHAAHVPVGPQLVSW